MRTEWWSVESWDVPGLRTCRNIDLPLSNNWCWILTAFPLTIDNILKCCPRGQPLQLLKILIITVNIFGYSLLLCQNRNAKRVNCSWDVSEALLHYFCHNLSHFRRILGDSEHFGTFWDVRAVLNSQYVVNIFLLLALWRRGSCSDPSNYWQYIECWWPF